MNKSYKVRIYPTKEQEILFYKHINCSRFIWNYMLEKQENRHKNKEKHLTHFDMARLLTPMKKNEEYVWLNDVSNATLNIVCEDLYKAYNMMFNKISMRPKFKSKKNDKKSFPVRCTKGSIYFNKDFVKVEKIGKLKYKTNYNIPFNKDYKFINPRIYLQGKKWILSLCMEFDKQELKLNDFSVGIDLGVKDTCIISYNGNSKKFHNINKSEQMRRLKRKLKHLQRDVSRKYEQNKQGKVYIKTNNIIELEEKIRRLHKRISDIRHNYNHHITAEITNLLPKRVVMEDLNISGMMKNRHLSRAIGEQCLYEITRQMKYKCEWKGIEFVQVDRFYPSSKLCNNCGLIKKDLKLSDRIYRCECGYVEDRDVNASRNLEMYVG